MEALRIFIFSSLFLISGVLTANEAAAASSSDKMAPESPPAANSNDFFNRTGFSIGAYRDSILGFVGKTQISSYLSDHSHAAALELEGGPRIFRLNATYSLALTDNHRLKLTGERLDEKLDFDAETDLVSRWVGQNAAGADYAYVLNHTVSDNRRLESWGFGGYYTHSGNKDLCAQTLPNALSESGYLTQHRIAGANSRNLHIDTAARLWPYSRLSAGVDHDKVRFDTHYYPDQNTQGFGGHAALEQRLLPTVKLTLGSDFRQIEHDYKASLSWLMPSAKGLRTEIEAIADFNHDLTSQQHYYTAGLRFNAVFDDLAGGSRQATYSDLTQWGEQSLLDWTRVPSVRMPAVLTVGEGVTVSGLMSCPGTIMSDGAGNYTAPDGWRNVSPAQYTGAAAFYYATFESGNPHSGRCTYQIDNVPTHTVDMANPYTGDKAGNGWDFNGGSQYRCNKANPNQCQFINTRVIKS